MPHFTFSQLSEVKLSEKLSPQVQIARVGKFNHPQYGTFEIKKDTLKQFKENFDNKVRGIDIAFDYFHDNDKIAAGWPKKLELRNNDTELWASLVEWTPKAQQMLSDKELRYFSPEFVFEWTNEETGSKFNNVLFGGGLTNRPFIKDMEPIVSLAESVDQACVSDKIATLVKEGYPQDQAAAIAYKHCGDKKMGDIKMDEKDKMIEDLKAQCAALQAELDKLKAEHEGMSKEKEVMMGDKEKQDKMMQDMQADKEKLCAEINTLKAEKVLAEKETKFNILLSEGKVCVAQKESFLKDDMEGFVKNSQAINLKESGTTETVKTSGDVVKDILKLAEAKRKEDKALDLGRSISLVLAENKELAKLYSEQN